MASSKKDPSLAELRGGGDSSMFGVTLQQLNDISELREKALEDKLNSPVYNGVNGILNKLKVDANKGLDSNNTQDLQQRQVAYGKNQFPHVVNAPTALEFVFQHQSWNEKRGIRKAQEEREKIEKTTVLRDNRTQQILLVDLVVGDICIFNAG